MSGIYTFEFGPRETLDRRGHPVVLAFYMKGRHYEATQPLEADEQAAKTTNVKHSPKGAAGESFARGVKPNSSVVNCCGGQGLKTLD